MKRDKDHMKIRNNRLRSKLTGLIYVCLFVSFTPHIDPLSHIPFRIIAISGTIIQALIIP